MQYDTVDDANFIINQLSNEFNLNISRCSKYCYGTIYVIDVLAFIPIMHLNL